MRFYRQTGLIFLTALHLSAHPCAGVEAKPLTISEIRELFNDELLDMAYQQHNAKNRYDDALQVAEKGIKSVTDNTKWYRRAAGSAEQAGKQELAFDYWLHLVEKGDGAARQAALRLVRNLNELPLRRKLFEDILGRGQGDAELMKEYLKTCEELGATGEAYNLLSSKLTFADRSFLLQELARLAELLGKTQDAVNALDQLSQLRPLTPQELQKKVTLQQGTGDLTGRWQQTFGKDRAAEEQEADLAARIISQPDEPPRSYSWSGILPEDEKEEQQRRYFRLEPTAVSGTVKYELNNEKRTVSGNNSKDTVQTVIERLDLVGQGYLYHPALLSFNLKFSPEFAHNFKKYSENSTEHKTEHNTENFNFRPNYQTNATILEKKPYSLNFYSQHLEGQAWASYTGLTQTVSDSYGADLQLNNNILPTTIGFSKSSSEQHGYNLLKSDWEELHLMTRHRGKKTGESNLSATYSENRQTTGQNLNSIKTFNSILGNQLVFADEDQIRLSSNLQYNYQDTSSNRTNSFFINEQLTWQHDPKLKSQYLYSYRQVNSDNSSNYWHSANANLNHTLYENLFTVAGISGVINETDGGGQDTGSWMFSTDYRRKLGSWGNIGLTAGITDQYNFRTGGVAQVLVHDEPHTLRSGSDTYLVQADVESSSIVVTNSAGSVIYLKNIDYRIDQTGSSTRISRLPLGSITEGQLVLISYSYKRSSAYNDRLFTHQYGASLELLSLLSLSYRYLQTDQSVLSGLPPDRLTNSKIHLATARIDTQWGESSFVYEDTVNTSDLSYTRWEGAQTLRLRYSNWLFGNLRGYYGETNYRNFADFKRTFGGSAGGFWSPYSWLKLGVEGYLEEIDGQLQHTKNSGGRVDAEASYRLWSLKLSYKYSDQKDMISNYYRNSQLLQLQLTRAAW